MTLDQLRGILTGDAENLGQNQQILQQFSGLVDASGNVNQQAVNDLANRVGQFQQTQDQLSQDALGYLGGIFNPTPFGQGSDEIGQAENERYLQALRGERPVSAGQLQAEREEFQQLREAAGQRGIRLDGNDLFTASSNSTAGNQLLARLRENAQTRRDSEVNNAIAFGGAQNINRLGLGLNQHQQLFNMASGLVQNPAAGSLGFLQGAQQFSPSNLSGSFLGLGQGYMQGSQPFENQRMLQYQRDLQNYSNNNAARSGIGGLIGGAIGLGLGSRYGMPGAALGYGIGSGAGSGFASIY
jgi:hypothetical protein